MLVLMISAFDILALASCPHRGLRSHKNNYKIKFVLGQFYVKSDPSSRRLVPTGTFGRADRFDAMTNY
jgi:hypothetical protein